MNALAAAAVSFVGFILAYRFYGKFISEKLFKIDPQNRCPAHKHNDGVDFVPTNRMILFGHHYTSIAGSSPIIGPAIAVIWGWLPAMLWVIFGSIFMGAVHDFGALIISARYEGKSIGEYTGEIISPGARILFLLLIFFLLTVVIALFAFIIATLFHAYPSSVVPIWFEVPLALFFGYVIYKRRGNIHFWAAVVLAAMMASIWVGTVVHKAVADAGYSMQFPDKSTYVIWIGILMGYVYIASTLPVHRLLQPRDYINSHQLFLCLGVILIGVVITAPKFNAPAINTNLPTGIPPLLPFLFITVACGAISGFHCLVASGTSSKQLDSECDARLVGYGGMLAEGFLSVMTIIACCAGLSAVQWHGAYSVWNKAPMGNFIQGSSFFISKLGISGDLAKTFMAVVIISFAATTLDTATRVQRYIVTELGSHFGLKPLKNRYLATLVAVGLALLLAFSMRSPDKLIGGGGMVLWIVFGTVNQLLAGLALLVATVYLYKRSAPLVYTLVPMAFVLTITGWAMIKQLIGFATNFSGNNVILFFIALVAFAFELGIIAHGLAVIAGEKQPSVLPSRK